MIPAVHLLMTGPLMAPGLADPDPAVEAGREALDRWWWQYPWYDAGTDGVERIEVSEPWYLQWDWFWDAFDFNWSGGGLGSMSWLNWLAWITIAFLLVLWIVGVTNSINLMDNMDGLCAGVSAISLFFFSLVTYQLGQQTFMILSMLALLGAVLGFLWHNFNPARIFMGDAGSMFIGFTLACLIVFSTFYTSQSETTILAIAMPPIILAVPLFDTLTVIAIRIKRGLLIYQADKNHFSHRLVALGMSHRNAVLLIYLVTLCTGIGALLLHQLNFFGGLIVLIQVAIILGVILLLERAAKIRNESSQE